MPAGVEVLDANTVLARRATLGDPDAAAWLSSVVDHARRIGHPTVLVALDAAARTPPEGFVPFDVERLPPPLRPTDAGLHVLRCDLPGIVSIRDPDPTWPQTFALVRDGLVAALGTRARRIEHTGSTSVPGLPAKPIIDVTLTVADTVDEPAYVPDLERAGYRLAFREPDWFEHRLLVRDWPRVNLHVFPDGCEEVERMVRFRDHLRADDADRERYAAVKRALAAREWAIVQDYADAKTDVVTEILQRADQAGVQPPRAGSPGQRTLPEELTPDRDESSIA